MNEMFNNLKKKLNFALQGSLNLTENLQLQYKKRVNPSESVRSNHSAELDIPPDVNVAAGCKLLAKYEDNWEVIHQNNEENAKKAQQLAKQIQSIEQNIIINQVVLSDMMVCLAAIPSLVEKLKACEATLVEVENLNEMVTNEFDKLQDLYEECELQEYMWQKQIELTKYKQRKMDELEVYRQEVAAKHHQRIQQHEEKLKQIQKERQAVFENEFRHDVENFKQMGYLPNKQERKIFDKQITLEEIILDDDTAEDSLEEFLKH